LLPADCEEFDTIFIFTAVKGAQQGNGGPERAGLTRRGGTLRRG
jgi:hypothetical protein